MKRKHDTVVHIERALVRRIRSLYPPGVARTDSQAIRMALYEFINTKRKETECAATKPQL